MSDPTVISLSQRRRVGFSRPLRILVTGSRMWGTPGLLHHVLDEVTRNWVGQIIIVHGQCDPRTEAGEVIPWDEAADYREFLLGADWQADQYALARGWQPERYPAKWKLYGKSAGHRRNAEMVKLGADVCVGFPQGPSPGTRGCIKLAVDARIPVRTEEGYYDGEV